MFGSYCFQPAARITEPALTCSELPLVLMDIKRGIVVSRNIGLKQGLSSLDVEREISNSLSCFSENVLRSVVKATLHNSPYDKSMRFNFMPLLQPVLNKYGMTEFADLRYKLYFN